ncbi:MAG: DUF4255 domain-containing protein [Synechococcales bacterium]|nr:DUF4255 domain-containing protein [Synechococcales bacterium]
MSNHLSIATVTAALQKIIQESIQTDVPGARVTTVRPDNSGSNVLEVGVNVFLYQVTPNPAWRNADLHTRRPKGELVKHGQAGLDLHYLMTFYGNEQELEPQRLLGSTVRALVDQPTLTPETIRATLISPNLSYLANSTLDDQVQSVKFIPSSITTEDLSRIWSIFFQTPYSLSLAYQGTAVLIQGEKPGRSPLPVRRRQFYVTPNRPIVDQVKLQGSPYQPITRESTLIIQGKQLQGMVTKVQIGEAMVTPHAVTDTQIILDLSSLPPTEATSLRAGIQTLQVVHLCGDRVQRQWVSSSNAVPFVLCPTVLVETVDVANLQQEDNGSYSADVTVPVDCQVTPEQRVFLLLNRLASRTPISYTFAATRREGEISSLTFPVRAIAPGEYLVRAQIDGAESPLNVDIEDQYSGPKLTISG